MTIKEKLLSTFKGKEGNVFLSVVTVQKIVTTIPYHAWNNRGAATMQVWLPTTLKNIKINCE